MPKAFDKAKIITLQKTLCETYTEILQTSFSEIPTSEKVIHSFKSRYLNKLENVKSKGRVYVTQNFILFRARDAKVVASIPIQAVSRMERMRSPKTKIYPTVAVHLGAGDSRILSHLYKRNDFCLIVEYLMKHTPTYLALPESDLSPQEPQIYHSSNDFTFEKSKPSPLETNGRAESEPVLDGRWKFFFEGEQESNEAKYEKVDIATADKVISLAEEIPSLQVDIREKIEEQAHTIDNISRNTDIILDNAKKGNYLGDEMRNSPIPAIRGAVGRKLHRELGEEEIHDRSPNELELDDHTDIPILLKRIQKLSLRQYWNGFIRFKRKEIVFFEFVGDGKPGEADYVESCSPRERCRMLFTEVQLIYVQNHPGHIGIRGADCDVELFSAYLQYIVNEIVLSAPQSIPVNFGVYAKQFDYGHEILRKMNAMNNTSEGAFSRPNLRVTETIMKNVPSQVRKDLEHQEEAIERAQAAVSTMNAIQKETQEELRRQNIQLDGVHSKVNKAQEKSNKAHTKVSAQI